MDNPFVAEDGTIIAITASLPDQQNLPEWLRSLEVMYSQMAGVPLPAWEEMKKNAALLFANARTKQMVQMNAVDALTLYRLLDLYKEDLEAIVYDQLERDSEPPETPEETVVYEIEVLDPDLDVGYASSDDGTLCDACYPDQRRSDVSYRVIYAPEAEAYGLVCRSCDRLLVKLLTPPKGNKSPDPQAQNAAGPLPE